MVNRRTFLTTSLGASLGSLIGCKNEEPTKLELDDATPVDQPVDLSEGGIWYGIGFGTEISAELWGVDEETGKRLMQQIEHKIAELEKVMSLYLENSELRILNRKRRLKKPSATFLDILTKAKALHKATLGYTQPAIHHIWQKVVTNAAIQPKDWQAASMDHLQITDSEIKLTHPLTQISLNSIGQGYATDAVAQLLRDAKVTCAKIDCGETYCIGKHPENRLWRLAVVGKGDLLGYIELADTGLAVSSSEPDKVLLDPVHRKITTSETTAAITTTAGACTADAFATAFATAPKKDHAKLLKALQATGEVQAKIW